MASELDRERPPQATQQQIQSVLLIDDAQVIHDLIEAHLEGENVALRHAFDATSGVSLAAEHRPDLILLDLGLPGIGGLEVCRQLQSTEATAAIPVIVLTGAVDTQTKVLAFDLGAVDYVTKPFDGVELRARVRAALRTKRYHDLLATRAQLDGLTGLWNRTHFDSRLREEVSVAIRTGVSLALALIDIDNFKRLNDSYGHPFGDRVLRQVADSLVGSVRGSDVVCRYGGEEFGLILRGATGEVAVTAAERMREGIAALNPSHNDRPVLVTASVGVAAADAFTDNEQLSLSSLLAAADEALYAAKRRGRNCVVRATPAHATDQRRCATGEGMSRATDQPDSAGDDR